MLFSTLFFLLIFSRYALGVEVKVTVGDEAVFSPTKPLPSPINSIAWKCISINTVIAIEWDEDGFSAPNDRFKGITTLNEKTGVMKIKPVNFNHIGEYFFEVNSKDQGERFKLTVANRVQKPVIEIESTENPDVVYLRCEYSEKIIWRNSAGKTLTGSAITPKGESITVTKNGDPESFYTCSLRNDVSEETSDRIYERDLFKDAPGGLSSGLIAFIVILLIIILLALAVFAGYYLNNDFRKCVRGLPCFPCFKEQGDDSTAGYKQAPISDDVEAEGHGGDSTAGNQSAQPTNNGEANNHGKKSQVDEINETEQGGDSTAGNQSAQATNNVEAKEQGGDSPAGNQSAQPTNNDDAEALKVNAAHTTSNSTGTADDKSAEHLTEAP